MGGALPSCTGGEGLLIFLVPKPAMVTFFVSFLSDSKQILGQYLKIVRERFLSHPSELISHRGTSRR